MTTYDETTINFNSAEATSPSDINILGEIVGLYAVGYTDYGFTYTNGNFATIGELGYGINNSGTIVGGPDLASIGTTNYTGINDSGTEVGYSIQSQKVTVIVGGVPTSETDVITVPIGIPQDPNANLSGPAGLGYGTEAYSINNAGEVVGDYSAKDGSVRGFLYSKGKFTTLNYKGSVDTVVSGINNEGQIVGSYILPDGTENGFIYSGYTSAKPGSGKYTTLKTNAGFGGINDLGQIVGEDVTPSDNGNGFLLSPSGDYGLDSTHITDIASSASNLANFDFVGAYLNGHSVGTGYDSLTPSLETDLDSAGLQTVSLYETAGMGETKSGNGKSFLSNPLQNGINAGKAAYKAALADGQGVDPGSAIYFGADLNPGSNQTLLNGIVTFFQGIKEGFQKAIGGSGPPEFTVGVYGSGLTDTTIINNHLATYSMLSGSTAWTGSSTYTSWNIKQSLPTTENGISVDPDVSNGSYFGQWASKVS